MRAPADAVNHRMLTFLDSGAQQERWAPKMRALREALEHVMRTDCGPAYMLAAANGAGVAALPTYVAQLDPRLKMLETGELARVRIWLVYDQSRAQIPRCQEVIAWVRELFDGRTHPAFREEFIKADDLRKLAAGKPGSTAKPA